MKSPIETVLRRLNPLARKSSNSLLFRSLHDYTDHQTMTTGMFRRFISFFFSRLVCRFSGMFKRFIFLAGGLEACLKHESELSADRNLQRARFSLKFIPEPYAMPSKNEVMRLRGARGHSTIDIYGPASWCFDHSFPGSKHKIFCRCIKDEKQSSRGRSGHSYFY